MFRRTATDVDTTTENDASERVVLAQKCQVAAANETVDKILVKTNWRFSCSVLADICNTHNSLVSAEANSHAGSVRSPTPKTLWGQLLGGHWEQLYDFVFIVTPHGSVHTFTGCFWSKF